MKFPKSERLQLLILFGYDGSKFHGVQQNKDLPTVALALRKRLELIFQQKPKALSFAARTDAGVDALQNAATCWFPPNNNYKDLINNFNNLSCKDNLFNIKATKVPYNVHARNNFSAKHYKYSIYNSDKKLLSQNNWQVVPKINIISMQKAASYLVGEHDFSSFRAKGCSAGSVIKKISEIKIVQDNRLISIHIKGNSFLRKMVRIIVGTLVEISTGLREPLDIKNILIQKNRSFAGVTAPAKGLILVKLF